MKFLTKTALLAVVWQSIFCAAALPASHASEAQDVDSHADFRELWKRVEQADSTVDFTQLRLAYTKTSEYDPYDTKTQDIRSEMDAAFNSKDYSNAADLANKLLKRDPLQTDAYVVLDISYEQMGDTSKSRFHHYVANGLIQSVLASGTGHSRNSAFQVISTDEEYIVLNYLGVKLVRQALVEEKDHSFDVMTVHGADNDSTYDLYFNIDLQMNALKDKLKDKQ